MKGLKCQSSTWGAWTLDTVKGKIISLKRGRLPIPKTLLFSNKVCLKDVHNFINSLLSPRK